MEVHYFSQQWTPSHKSFAFSKKLKYKSIQNKKFDRKRNNMTDATH